MIIWLALSGYLQARRKTKSNRYNIYLYNTSNLVNKQFVLDRQVPKYNFHILIAYSNFN